MTAGAFLRWLPSRLWCSVVGHRWTEADDGVPSRYGLVSGYRCRRYDETTPSPLFVWQRLDGEGSE